MTRSEIHAALTAMDQALYFRRRIEGLLTEKTHSPFHPDCTTVGELLKIQTGWTAREVIIWFTAYWDEIIKAVGTVAPMVIAATRDIDPNDIEALKRVLTNAIAAFEQIFSVFAPAADIFARRALRSTDAQRSLAMLAHACIVCGIGHVVLTAYQEHLKLYPSEPQFREGLRLLCADQDTLDPELVRLWKQRVTLHATSKEELYRA